MTPMYPSTDVGSSLLGTATARKRREPDFRQSAEGVLSSVGCFGLRGLKFRV